MFKLFMEGGLVPMSVLTVLLVAVLLAAWKAPRWEKEIGAFALVTGVLSFILGHSRMLSTLQQVAMGNDSVSSVFDLFSPGVFFGGIKVGLIPVIYGMIIYLLSLVIRVVQKPRL